MNNPLKNTVLTETFYEEFENLNVSDNKSSVSECAPHPDFYRLVLLRHGQSEWNSEDRLTGWTDVNLSQKGLAEAVHAGKLLFGAGLLFDVAYTSLLKRAIKTLWIVLEEMDQMWVPTKKTWRLNERHYGALQGVDRDVIVKEYGIDAVEDWRRSYHAAPPLQEVGSSAYIATTNDRRYADMGEVAMPLSESLFQTWERVKPWWEERVKPDLMLGKTVLVAAHGNVLRALCKHLKGLSDEDIKTFFFNNATPVVLHLDKNFAVIEEKVLT